MGTCHSTPKQHITIRLENTKDNNIDHVMLQKKRVDTPFHPPRSLSMRDNDNYNYHSTNKWIIDE